MPNDIELEFIKHIIDKYTGAELVELLGISTEDICERFECRVLEAYNELWEDLQFGN